MDYQEAGKSAAGETAAAPFSSAPSRTVTTPEPIAVTATQNNTRHAEMENDGKPRAANQHQLSPSDLGANIGISPYTNS